jgi:hypothetical protein
MQSSQPPLSDTARCPICRASLESALPFCPVCGAQLDDAHARDEEELRGVLYLLSELERWESSGEMGAEQAARLRESYEHLRDRLRAELAAQRVEKLKQPAPSKKVEPPPAAQTTAPRTEQTRADYAPTTTPAQHDDRPRRESEFVAFPAPPTSKVPPRAQAPHAFRRPERTLLERLADPHTLRLLLYTGAGMLVVGVVIWLRDLLYLKLQEPVVQAGLLAFGTAAFIASGWYTTLRTRQRWTGRALTLAGSLLFPVNFWFLVRSGLIENHGRAWVVCAFCAVLYANTAAILRERLYVYLATATSVATLWALIFRDTPRAFGLYALTLVMSSLVFIHLSQVFPATKDDEKGAEEESDAENGRSNLRFGRWSSELWSAPLARAALAFAALSALIYMPLRFAPDAASFYDGIFRLRSSTYDAGTALLILAACAYILWFAGRSVYTKLGGLFYTASALLFFLAVWVACDGIRLSSQASVLALSLVTFLCALIARSVRTQTISQPLYYASLIVVLILAIASVSVVLNSSGVTMTHSAGLALITASFVALSSVRSGVGQAALAHFAALYFSASYFAVVGSAALKSESLNTLLCAAWPLLLYGAAELTESLKRETQLSIPFTRVADAIAVLLFLWGALLALLIHLMSGGGGVSRSSAILSLLGVVLYGTLRTARERSVFAAALGTLASVVMTAALLDALQRRGAWPGGWPIAAGAIIFAFLLERACARLLRPDGEAEASATRAPLTAIRVVLDWAVIVCAIIWLVTAFTLMGAGGYGAPSVLLLALLYWVERAFTAHLGWAMRIACASMAAFLFTLLIALHVDPEWRALLFTLTLFPTLFILSRYAYARDWLRAPLNEAAVVSLCLSFALALIQAAPYLEAGDIHLLAASLNVGAVALLSFMASIFSRGRASVLYFRAGLGTAVASIMLASLRAGFDPIADAEIYSTPIAVLILIIAYLSHRRAWAEYERDVGALLWVGSMLLCAPLLGRALEFRLLLDSPAPWRDVAVLAASLALILYGVVGRMRAPVITGFVSLITELSILTLTSVNWLQVPLKYYLMTVGALLLIIFGTLEYRREQFLRLRQSFQERRDRAREQFGEWR